MVSPDDFRLEALRLAAVAAGAEAMLRAKFSLIFGILALLEQRNLRRENLESAFGANKSRGRRQKVNTPVMRFRIRP